MSTHYLIRLEADDKAVLAQIQDECGLVDNLLIPDATVNRGLARHIDPYGTTTFNGAQSETLLDECQSISSFPSLSIEQRFVLNELLGLFRRAATEVHLHVSFLGD